MSHVDRLGRRRQPGQHRGLRSLFPTLPAECQSRLMRVAMSAAAWARLDALIAASAAPTAPRAIGALIESWLAADVERVRVPASPTILVTPLAGQTDAVGDWQDWQMRKELALLASVRSSPSGDQPTVH